MGKEKDTADIFRAIGIAKEKTAQGIIEQRRLDEENKKKSKSTLEIDENTDLDLLEKMIDEELKRARANQPETEEKSFISKKSLFQNTNREDVEIIKIFKNDEEIIR